MGGNYYLLLILQFVDRILYNQFVLGGIYITLLFCSSYQIENRHSKPSLMIPVT
jgi:hypothetical protein